MLFDVPLVLISFLDVTFFLGLHIGIFIIQALE